MTDSSSGPPSRPPLLHLTVTRSTGRGVRLTSPQLQGWAAVARGPVGIARAVDQAWTELDIAATAARNGQVPDFETVAEPDTSRQPEAVEAGRRFGTPAGWGRHDPARWTPLPGDVWRSPSGRRYRADTQVVQRVIENRRARNLPIRPSGA